jgi:hypothetical protein
MPSDSVMKAIAADKAAADKIAADAAAQAAETQKTNAEGQAVKEQAADQVLHQNDANAASLEAAKESDIKQYPPGAPLINNKTGKIEVDPMLTLADPFAPALQLRGQGEPPVATPAPVSTPVIASNAPIDAMSAASPGPTVKEMIASVIKPPATPAEAQAQAETGKALATEAATNPSFGDMLKKLGRGILGVINAYGMGYSGHPEQAQYRIQQQQEFEKAQAQTANEARMKELQAQAKIQTETQAIEQRYNLDRMNIQNQMNVANLPIEKKAELENSLAVVEANKKADLEKLDKEYGIYFQKLGINPKANGGTFWTGG